MASLTLQTLTLVLVSSSAQEQGQQEAGWIAQTVLWEPPPPPPLLPPPMGKATGQHERDLLSVEGLEMKGWWRTAALYCPSGETGELQLNLLLGG